MSADPNVLAKARDGAVRVERYQIKAGRLIRRVSRRDGTVSETDVCEAPGRTAGGGGRSMRSQISGTPDPIPGSRKGSAPARRCCRRSVQRYRSLEPVIEAARALDLSARLVLAADADPAPLQVLRDSLNPLRQTPRCVDLGRTLTGKGPEPNAAERALLSDCPDDIDILVAGPPCPGHSRLNNHTRHDDPRNRYCRGGPSRICPDSPTAALPTSPAGRRWSTRHTCAGSTQRGVQPAERPSTRLPPPTKTP